MSAESTPNRVDPWTSASYGSLTGSGAAKLADSAVAPLVAMARGYYRVADKTQTKALAERATAESVISLTRRLNTMVAGDEDILVMPWHALSEVSEKGTAARSYNTQYRPSKPIRNAEGKTAKYAWFAGERLVLDLHPATPATWLDDSLDVLLTEGVIKGDAALTALLLDAGVTHEVLSQTPDSTESARALLNSLMGAVPKSRRMPIINSASVTTWEDQADQWRHIRFTDKRVIIAFDGDLAENRMVWRQTKKAMQFVRDRKGSPTILSMFSPEVEMAQIAAGMDPADKLGIDDYLSHIGDWQGLLSLTTDMLPAEPDALEHSARVGEWRVHPGNDARVQEYCQEMNFDGSKTPAQWVDRYRIGGRVVSTISKRRPTQHEIRTGMVDSTQEMLFADEEVELELAVLGIDQDFDQEPSLYRFVGPATLLAVAPTEWHRYVRSFPAQVLDHPEWPPRKGQDWLAAVKANRRSEIDTGIAWSTMGWVPNAFGHPAFVIGNQVLGKTEKDEDVTRTAVTDRTLSGVSEFGLVDTYRQIVQVGADDEESNLDAYKAQVRADIKTVLTAYIENGFWKDRAAAVCVTAAMLRATIPMRPGISLYFSGTAGSGKSYSAGFVLSGWESVPHTWNASHLNGSADDTFAALEDAVSLVPIWVVDDLAPQVDRRKAETQETSVSQLLRNNLNGSGKRRMNGATMTQREVAAPIAMLIMTAENTPQVASAEARAINVRIAKGAFDDTEGGRRERELKAAVRDSAPSRLNAAMVRMWQRDDTGMGTTWAERQKYLTAMYEDEKDVAEAVLLERHGFEKGVASRAAGQVASLGLSFQALYNLALWAGVKKTDPLLRSFGSGEGSYMDALYELAANSIQRTQEASPGRSLVGAIARMLASGKAHLRNPTTPGAPPFKAVPDDNGGVNVGGMNEAAGWEFDSRANTWVPRGVPIGYLGAYNDVEQVAVIDMQTGFQEAKRHFPSLIPHGQLAPASWESVWQEKLTALSVVRKSGPTARISISAEPGASSHRISGVPVAWKAIVDTDLED